MLARADNMTIILDRVRLTSLVINTVRENITITIIKTIVNYKTSVRGLELNEESIFDWELPTQFEPYQTQLPTSEVNSMQLPISEEINTTTGIMKLAKKMQSNKLLFFSSEKICLTVDVANIDDILALANNGCIEFNTMTFRFNNKPTEFGTDNCATHHICHLLHF